MINSVENVIRETPVEQEQNISQVKNISYRGTDYERTPGNDSFETEKKNNTGKIIGISLAAFTAAAIMTGLICLKKGGNALKDKADSTLKEKFEAGWKELTGKKTAKTTDSKKPEETPTAEEKPKTGEKPKPEGTPPAATESTTTRGLTRIEDFDFNKYKSFADIPEEERVVKDAKGNILREIYSIDGKDIDYIKDYYPGTTKMMRSATILSDGKHILSISNYDFNTGKVVNRTSFWSSSKNVQYIQEFDIAGGKEIKCTWYKGDGKTIDNISEYDPVSGKEIKTTWYKDDGTTVDHVDTY